MKLKLSKDDIRLGLRDINTGDKCAVARCVARRFKGTEVMVSWAEDGKLNVDISLRFKTDSKAGKWCRKAAGESEAEPITFTLTKVK
jgi:hypothetical protein